MTNTQPSWTAKDLRRARSALNNLSPTTTGCAIAITLTYLDLTGRLNGHAVRMPLLNALAHRLRVRSRARDDG